MGAVIPHVTVEERLEDWKRVLRSSETDNHGRCRLSRRPSTTICYLKFSHDGFNRVRIKLQLEKKAASGVVVKLPVAT
jgi:hypothetical protein